MERSIICLKDYLSIRLPGYWSGTLQQTGSITFSLTATEESGCSKIQDYTINVSEFNYQAGPHVSWITPIYGSGFDHSKSSAIDKEGNIYFSTTYGDITFNESASFLTLPIQTL